jgi:hypothetical protein
MMSSAAQMNIIPQIIKDPIKFMINFYKIFQKTLMKIQAAENMIK